MTLGVIVQSLTDQNFIIYAARNYDNAGCISLEEFEEDIKRFQYLKKLFGKYRDTGVLKTRLILNHIIIIQNVFGNKQAIRMIFLKLKDFYSEVCPFLIYLNTLPDIIQNINGLDVQAAEVNLNSDVIQKLRNFNNAPDETEEDTDTTEY